MSMMSTSFISPRHSVCSLPLRSIFRMSCCVSVLLVRITPVYTKRACCAQVLAVCKNRKSGGYTKCQLRKRNLGMGWLWSARWCSTPHLRFMLCGAFPISYVHNKPLFRGLSVATRGELSNAYALIIAHDTTEKLAKFQIKKVGRSHDQPLVYALSSSSLTTRTRPY